jgi:hypothetical protein
VGWHKVRVPWFTITGLELSCLKLSLGRKQQQQQQQQQQQEHQSLAAVLSTARNHHVGQSQPSTHNIHTRYANALICCPLHPRLLQLVLLYLQSLKASNDCHMALHHCQRMTQPSMTRSGSAYIQAQELDEASQIQYCGPAAGQAAAELL